MATLKVSNKSEVKKVAGAIAGELKKEKIATIIAVGPHAVNQTVKAIATARGFVTQDGFDLTCVPNFEQVKIDTEDRAAIRFTVKLIGDTNE